MKKFLTAVAMALLLVGCTRETVDLSGINEKLAELDNRVSALEGAVAAIQSTIGDGVFVQKAEPYVDPETGKTIGVTVTYTTGKVVYFEISPKADYAGPVLGVIRSGSGSLVWAVDGIAIKDAEGNEVPVNKTPAFTIDEDGYLWVSIDGGDPVKLGQVQNEGATLVDGIFKDIKVEQDKVVLVLSDDSIVNIPFAEAFKLVIEGTEFINDGKAITIPYTVSGKTAATEVGVTGYDPTAFYVEVTDENIVITPNGRWCAATMLAYADSKVGLTSLVKLTIAPEGAIVVDPSDDETGANYVAESEGGDVEMHVVSNVEIEAKVDEAYSWISIVDTKARAYTISAKIAENKGDERYGYIYIYKKGTNKFLQTISVYQAKSTVDYSVDLSEVEAANSYIITAAGDYKFKAVKGNSAESVGTVDAVELLWETYNNAEEVEANSVIAKVGASEGFIRFSTPETLKPGNALIAAKDAEGKILWSWHIWIPVDAITVQDAEAFAGAKMLDRNLGALKAAGTSGDVDPLSIGLYYQWGRKDPFPGATNFANEPTGATVAGTAWTYHQEKISTAYSIEHPTEYASVPKVDAGVWNADDPKNLWDTEAHTKTIYDPCPPGYRVPRFDKTLPMWKGADDGFTFEGSRIAFGAFTFPIAGYIDCYGASYVYSDQRTHVWAADWYDAERGSAMYFRLDKSPKYYSQKYHKAKAGSVRCVVDPNAPKPEVPAVDLSEKATANCYVVSEAGKFKFKTVKGNSEESVGVVETATLVWETYNNAEEVTANSVIAEVSYADNYITFSTPETLKPGNALIAAKDADGKILWSWHIWIPKTAITEDTYGLGEVKMMSRALGALVDADGTASAKPDITSIGLMYQWGRKDPFMNAGSFFSSTGAHGAATAPADVFKTSATAGATIAYSIENPTEYIKGADDENTWCSETTDANWAAAKTIYDPCPPGYRVPQSSEVLLLNKAKADIPGWDSSHKDYNWFVCGNPTTQFANAGFIEETGLDHYRSVERVIIWSSTVYTDSKRARCALYNGGSVSADTKQAQARAGIVRCVVDAPAAE